MRLQATIRGNNLAELNANAISACDRFFGPTPYVIQQNEWDQASVDTVDASGNPLTFVVSIQANPTP